MKTIIVTFFGNPMPHTDGNLARIRAVLQFLVDSGFRVFFYSFAQTPEQTWTAKDEAAFHDSFPGVSLVLEKWGRGIHLVERIKSNLTALVPGLTARILALSVPGLTPKWKSLRAEHPDAIYLHNYALNTIQLNGVSLAKACIETHDLYFREHALAHRRPVWHWSILRFMRRELSILEASAVVLAIARGEHVMFDAFLRAPMILYLPPHYLPQRNPAQLESEIKSEKKADLLFLGSGNYKNIRGINRFLKEFREWRTRPPLAIAGKVSGHVEIDPDHDDPVSVLGFVPDLSGLYQSVRAIICPIEGTGVNIKLLEALAYGKPAFASHEAIAALPPGWEGCVFPLSEASVSEVLGNPAKLRAASIAALKYVDSPYIRSLWSDFKAALLSI